MSDTTARLLALLVLATSLGACGGAQKDSGSTLGDGDDGDNGDPAAVDIVEYEKKTKELLDTSAKLNETTTKLDDQRRRLQLICTDYPDHQVCAIQTAASYAREAFCKEPEFVKHVDEVVAACHQGECKQIDEAHEITRTQYMTLTQRLPHSLVTFNAANTKLDANDKKQLQGFVEALQGEKGYIIIVGRASKDGQWRNNLKYALERAESSRKFLVEEMGLDSQKVGYITYGADKMYLTELDVERLTQKKLTTKQANRSALIFSYPCFEGKPAAPVDLAPPPPPSGAPAL